MSILNVGQLKTTLGTGAIEEWSSEFKKPQIQNIETPGEATPQSFASFLKSSINGVNHIQSVANESVQRLVSGEEQDIH